MSGAKLKIALVGPRGSGKTRLANYLAREVELLSGVTPDGTKGARILQAERDVMVPGRARLSVELWDVGGDESLRGCWPAVAADLDAVAVVFDPTSREQAGDVKGFCRFYAAQARLAEGQVVVWAHGDLVTPHKPLSIQAEGERRVPTNIANVSMAPPAGAPEGTPTSADAEFDQLVAAAFRARQGKLEKDMD